MQWRYQSGSRAESDKANSKRLARRYRATATQARGHSHSMLIVAPRCGRLSTDERALTTETVNKTGIILSATSQSVTIHAYGEPRATRGWLILERHDTTRTFPVGHTVIHSARPTQPKSLVQNINVKIKRLRKAQWWTPAESGGNMWRHSVVSVNFIFVLSIIFEICFDVCSGAGIACRLFKSVALCHCMCLKLCIPIGNNLYELKKMLITLISSLIIVMIM